MIRILRFLTLFAVLAVIALFLSLAAPATATAQSIITLTGQYFNNTTLSGAPVLTRANMPLNFDWGYGSPDPRVHADNFSVRWQGTYYLPVAGTYGFTLVSDDGSRVWVDGQLVLDMWYDHAALARTASVTLSQGWHAVRVEYYERTGTAMIRLGVELAITSESFPDWKGEYFNNQWLSGSPMRTVNDTELNFNWGNGSPASGIPADHFSVRWTCTEYFNAGKYRFTVTADDGIRLWVDNTLLINQWHDQAPTTHVADINLGAGNHSMKVEYYENGGGAVAQVSYSAAPVTPRNVWLGSYYNNPWLSGAPVWTRQDADLNFNWGEASPGGGIPADNFSVKWDSVRDTTTAGNYVLTVTTDDGVRVWVDGNIVLDAWYDQVATHSNIIYLSAGAHNWHVEYYEHAGGAQIHLQLYPAYVPPPSADIVVDDGGAGWVMGGTLAWWHSAGGYGGHSYWTYNDGFVVPGYNWARWSPALPHAGNYEVFAYIPNGIASTRSARYWIAHAGTLSQAIRAQAFYPNQWMSLGTYYFTATGGENVSLSDVTYEAHLYYMVVWDALKFSPR